MVLPETFLPVPPRFCAGLPKLLFNQNGSYSFGFREGDGFPKTAEAVLNLYSHSTWFMCSASPNTISSYLSGASIWVHTV